MRRSVLLLLALSACKVEPTPRSFYNHRTPAVVELNEAEGEIRTRVISFVAALNRADSTAALEAMNPSELVQVLGPSDADSMAVLGSPGLLHAMGEVRRPADAVARTPDLRVGAGQGIGWFSTHVELLPVSADARSERLRLSGVFARERGIWRLVQAHLSQPALAPDSAAAAPDSAGAGADSASAESRRSRDSAAAGAEGG